MTFDKDASIKLRERDWLNRLLNDLSASQYYGSIEIKFEGGRVVRVFKNQSLCPPMKTQE